MLQYQCQSMSAKRRWVFAGYSVAYLVMSRIGKTQVTADSAFFAVLFILGLQKMHIPFRG